MPPKGKQGTKGQKQIFEENKDTLTFYRNIILASNAVFLVPTFFLYWDEFTTLYITLLFTIWAVYAGSYKFMTSMANPSFDGAGNLLDGGIDLNMPQGMAENMKDIIILTAATQFLALISNYFWFLLLLVPGRAFYMLWVNILSPWIFAPAPEEEIDDKKQQKRDRKIKYKTYR